jgi:hypothetical protein
MKKLSYLFVSGLASTLMLVGTMSTALVAGSGCSSSGSGGSGGSSGTGGGSGSGVTGIPLVSSDTGFVMDATSGVVGAWYAYGDGVGPGASVALGDDHANSDCILKGGFPQSACTAIATPSPGQPFMPTDLATSQMCTAGVAAQVMNKGGAADYSDLWGGGIGLDFNNPGGDAGVKSDKDLSAYKGIAFDFSVYTGPGSNPAGIPASAMRVNFPFTGEHGTDSPYWMGGTKASSPLKEGHFEVDWTDVGGPLYLTTQSPPVTPPPFDVTKVQAIQFQVTTTLTATTSYSFCVANLALLPKTP